MKLSRTIILISSLNLQWNYFEILIILFTALGSQQESPLESGGGVLHAGRAGDAELSGDVDDDNDDDNDEDNDDNDDDTGGAG